MKIIDPNTHTAITRIVQVQWDGLHVRLLDPRSGQLLREHLRQARGRRRIEASDQLFERGHQL